MDQPIDHAFAAEQMQYEESLSEIRQLDPAEADSMVQSEKMRHLMAILSLWKRHTAAAVAKPVLSLRPIRRVI